jgi:alcohol dehydrogenase
MQSFDFQPRTRLVFGAGSLSKLGELARAIGGRRVLVVSDPGIIAAGYTSRAIKAIEGAGLAAFLFDGVEENPNSRNVENGVTFAAEHHVDLLVGLGGGSSMDCAKGINFVLTSGFSTPSSR